MKQEWKPRQNGDNCVGNAARLLPLFKPKGCNCKCQAAHFTPRAHDTSTGIANNPIYTPRRYNDILPVLRLESIPHTYPLHAYESKVRLQRNLTVCATIDPNIFQRDDNFVCVLVLSFQFFCFFFSFLLRLKFSSVEKAKVRNRRKKKKLFEKTFDIT